MLDRNRFRGMKNSPERKSTLRKALLRILDVLCLEIIVLVLLEGGVLYACREYAISFPNPQSAFPNWTQGVAHRSRQEDCYHIRRCADSGICAPDSPFLPVFCDSEGLLRFLPFSVDLIIALSFLLVGLAYASWKQDYSDWMYCLASPLSA